MGFGGGSSTRHYVYPSRARRSLVKIKGISKFVNFHLCGQTLFRIFLIFVFICGHKQTNRQKRFRLDCVKKSHSATFGCLAAISRAVAITKKKASGLQKDYKKSVGIIIRNRMHNWLPDFQLESTTFLPGIQVESANFFNWNPRIPESK